MSLTDVNADVHSGGEKLSNLAVDGITPGAVVRPSTYEEASSFLKEANSAGKKVAIRGGGTKSGLGNPIKGLDVVLGTGNLNKILEYEVADMTLAVQAGANLAALQAELEKNGQFLPVESPLSSQATIGGAIAANSSGPNRLQYGPARDWLIGVRFALADGTIAHAGGRVVKNVAGYDLMKLYIGSLGTLGLILDLNFKLLPMPKSSSTLVVNFKSEQEACEAALRIIDKGIFATSLTVVDERAAAALNLPAKNSLLVEVRNTAQAVERQVRDTSQLVRGLWANGMERISEPVAQKQLWTKVTDFGYRPELNDKLSFTLKTGIVPTQSAMMLRQAKLIAEKNGVAIESLAHAGHGILYITGQYAPEQEAAALHTISDFTAKVESSGGSVVAEKLPLSLKQRLSDVWGNALREGELKLMRGIKEKLDPNQTLNPGRFVNKI